MVCDLSSPPSLPTWARLPINRCNLPAAILGSLTYQRHPVPLKLDGVEDLAGEGGIGHLFAGLQADNPDLPRSKAQCGAGRIQGHISPADNNDPAADRRFTRRPGSFQKWQGLQYRRVIETGQF